MSNESTQILSNHVHVSNTDKYTINIHTYNTTELIVIKVPVMLYFFTVFFYKHVQNHETRCFLVVSLYQKRRNGSPGDS